MRRHALFCGYRQIRPMHRGPGVTQPQVSTLSRCRVKLLPAGWRGQSL